MAMEKQVEDLLFSAIDEINEQLPDGHKVQKTMDTPLFGENSVLDSLGLVNLIVNVEQKVQTGLNLVITIADEKAMSQRNSPFRTIGSLAQYIVTLVQESTA